MKYIENAREAMRRNRSLRFIWRHILFLRDLLFWSLGLRKYMPAAMKRSVLCQFGTAFKVRNFVETGTYLGDTLARVSGSLELSRIYSIELSTELAQRAKRRFVQSPHITILQGDSGDLLESIAKDLKDPTLFWLDAHYSMGITARGLLETPIEREIRIVLKYWISGSVCLIDDARHFTGEGDYPTVERVKEVVRRQSDNFEIVVRNDIIRIYEK